VELRFNKFSKNKLLLIKILNIYISWNSKFKCRFRDFFLLPSFQKNIIMQIVGNGLAYAVRCRKKPALLRLYLADPNPQLHMLMPVDYITELTKPGTAIVYDVTTLYSEYE